MGQNDPYISDLNSYYPGTSYGYPKLEDSFWRPIGLITFWRGDLEFLLYSDSNKKRVKMDPIAFFMHAMEMFGFLPLWVLAMGTQRSLIKLEAVWPHKSLVASS